MSANSKTVRIFILPQQFPCGPQSSCCGPVGQSEKEVQTLSEAIAREFNMPIEIHNATDGQAMRNHLQILRLVRSLGPLALPVISLDEEVVSIGNPTPDQAVSAIKAKIGQA